MKKYELKTILTLIILIFLFSCGKQTEPYKSKLLCLVNGREHYTESNNKDFFLHATYSPKRDQLLIVSNNPLAGINHSQLNLRIFEFTSDRPYFDETLNDHNVAIDLNGNYMCNSFGNDKNFPLKIKINYLNKTDEIVQGEFNFTATNVCGDTVHVTDGEFDLNYRTRN